MTTVPQLLVPLLYGCTSESCQSPVCVAVRAALAEHDRRVTELLTANSKLVEERRAAFLQGAYEGWTRCGVFYVDLNFEGDPDALEQFRRRWNTGQARFTIGPDAEHEQEVRDAAQIFKW